MSNTDNDYVLFYSNNCDYCKEFLIRLSKLNVEIFNTFLKICVDNNPNLPPSINSVPTIIIPSHEYPLTGDSVFMWLDGIDNQPVNHPEKQINNEKKESDIAPYISQEMGNNFSDNFSFLDNNQSMSHNFTFLDRSEDDNNNNNNNNNIINEHQSDLDRPHMSNNSRDKNDFDNNYEQFINNRDNDPAINHVLKRT
jgi:hypothetical protein